MFGGEIWILTPWPVWVTGSLLALHAGWMLGIWAAHKLGLA